MAQSSLNNDGVVPGLLLRVSGRWAHFKKPETNNNPLTHDFITKTALLGLMGAVLGVERRSMRGLFPQWSDDLKYGVQLQRAVRKTTWAFTMRGVVNHNDKAPKAMEVLKEPDYIVALACENARSSEALQAFSDAVRQGHACYTPVLGLHNCAADLEFIEAGKFGLGNGVYSTRGFALCEHHPDFSLSEGFRFGFERLPTHQNDDFWNNPEKYKDVCYVDYTDGQQTVNLTNGVYHRFNNGEAWCLI